MSKNYFFIWPQKKFDYKLRQAQAPLKKTRQLTMMFVP